jgi:hypothetical protein
LVECKAKPKAKAWWWSLVLSKAKVLGPGTAFRLHLDGLVSSLQPTLQVTVLSFGFDKPASTKVPNP